MARPRSSREATCVLGIDLGTSACKACVMTDAGDVLGAGAASYPTHTPHPGWVEQNPLDWLGAVADAARQAVRAAGMRSRQVSAVALSSAAHVGVLLDRTGVPVRHAILWNDQRSSAQVAQLERAAGETILRRTCQAVSTTWTLAHLAWVRENDRRAWQRVRTLMLSKDFIIRWMTGECVTDRATAVSSQLWDIASDAWSKPLSDRIGLDVQRLPRVVDACETAGTVRSEVARAIGIDAGTPVIVGTLDSATELLAAGLVNVGDAMVRLATAGGLQWLVGKPTPDRHRITYPHVVRPTWYCQAGTSTCAAAVAWGRSLLAGVGASSYESFDRLAGTAPPGCDGLIFHPYLAGERAPYWEPSLRAQFTGLTLGHGAAHLARSIYEGTAMSIADAMRLLPRAIRTRSSPLAVVGGGTRSQLWLTILASTLGRPLQVIDNADSARGAAILGLAGLRADRDVRAVLSRLQPAASRVIAPDPSRTTLYRERFARYRQLVESLRT